MGVADGGQDERHEQPRVGRALGDVGGAASKGGGNSGVVGCDDGEAAERGLLPTVAAPIAVPVGDGTGAFIN